MHTTVGLGFFSSVGQRALAAGLLLLALAFRPALADVWGYVDEKGTAHFAAEQLDARYELFYRGGDAPAADAGGTPRAVGVPTAPPRLLAYFEVSPSYKSVKHVLREASTTHNIDYDLLKALIATESGFNAAAVSPKGAIGLMQVMPATAGRYGVTTDARRTVEQKLSDPQTNIRTGTRYLSHLIKLFPGQLELALAAYNAGEGAVQRAGNRIPAYRETQNYVKTVMQLYTLLKPPVTVARQAAEGRVRMTLPPGATAGRANMISPSSPVLAAPVPAPVNDVFY
jgi:soluble lytic murein transglycosylase-like protein